MERSGSFISAIFASRVLSPFSLPARSSWTYSFIAAFSSSVNPLVFLPGAVTRLPDLRVFFVVAGLMALPNMRGIGKLRTVEGPCFQHPPRCRARQIGRAHV